MNRRRIIVESPVEAGEIGQAVTPALAQILNNFMSIVPEMDFDMKVNRKEEAKISFSLPNIVGSSIAFGGGKEYIIFDMFSVEEQPEEKEISLIGRREDGFFSLESFLGPYGSEITPEKIGDLKGVYLLDKEAKVFVKVASGRQILLALAALAIARLESDEKQWKHLRISIEDDIHAYQFFARFPGTKLEDQQKMVGYYPYHYLPR